jgi:hypothetical protein
MGVSIHYSGKLKVASILQAFVEELEDNAKILKRTFKSLLNRYPNDKFEDKVKIYGIIVLPPECEPVVFVFDYESHIHTPWLKQYFMRDFICIILVQKLSLQE